MTAANVNDSTTVGVQDTPVYGSEYSNTDSNACRAVKATSNNPNDANDLMHPDPDAFPDHFPAHPSEERRVIGPYHSAPQADAQTAAYGNSHTSAHGNSHTSSHRIEWVGETDAVSARPVSSSSDARAAVSAAAGEAPRKIDFAVKIAGAKQVCALTLLFEQVRIYTLLFAHDAGACLL